MHVPLYLIIYLPKFDLITKKNVKTSGVNHSSKFDYSFWWICFILEIFPCGNAPSGRFGCYDIVFGRMNA